MARSRHRKSQAPIDEGERESGDNRVTSDTIASTEPRLTPQQRAGIQVAYQNRLADAQKLADQNAKERATAQLERLLQAGREEIQAILEREAADGRQQIAEEAAGLRQRMDQEASDLRQRIEEEAADLRQRMEKEARDLRQRMEEEAADLRQRIQEEAADLRQRIQEEAAGSRQRIQEEAAGSRQRIQEEAADIRQRIDQDVAERRQQAEATLAGEVAETRARENSRINREFAQHRHELDQQLNAYSQQRKEEVETALAQRWTQECERVDDELARQLELRMEEAEEELSEQRAQDTVPILPAWWLMNGRAQPAGAQEAGQEMEVETEADAEEWVNPEWRARFQRSTVDAAPGTTVDQPQAAYGGRLLMEDPSEMGSPRYSPTPQFRQIPHAPETPTFDLEDIGTALVVAHNAPASAHGRQVSADTEVGTPQPPAEAPSSP
ncbi:hypothetical protein IE81DRAFT_100081 [Ceraceosorus guamensis]|uniref:Uncharacterized protein n=1 Tax=Ceraceosorus guamensis TaxID=1522189 RepID=A0A316W140_9BASI|nr:hypothetical protein IE81DRAFT_100081 [Ceraceosorus guamensis]PWN43214.1 hypothetical protein IE81DRAFT_100081 [Ceraceosorus guamensis]